MKYLIKPFGKDALLFAEILANELFRYDVRADINGFDELEGLKNSCFNSSYSDLSNTDLIIQIGDKFDKKLHRISLRKKSRTCFIATNSWNISEGTIGNFDLIFWDRPTLQSDLQYVGHYILDITSKHLFKEIEDNYTYKIGLLNSNSINTKSLNRLMGIIRDKYPDVKLLVTSDFGISGDNKRDIILMKSEFDILKNANLVLVSDNDFSLKSALLNCPQVLIHNSNWSDWLKPVKRSSIVNTILNNEVLSSIPIKQADLVLAEVAKVLENHEYCASLMTEYQKVREKLGHPAARNMALKITELLDD